MGKISDKINELIETKLKSAVIFSPRFSDYRVQESLVTQDAPDSDFMPESTDAEDKSAVQTRREEAASGTSKKDEKKINDLEKGFKAIREGNLGEIEKLSSAQFGNIKQMATDPSGFVFGALFKKLGRGLGILALAVLIEEAVKFIINQALKPGRWLDRRFKRDMRKEILQNRRREDQQRLKQGLSSIIITTGPRLRGGQGQFVNTLEMVAGREKWPDNIGLAPITKQASGQSLSKANGRRNFGGPGR